MRASADHDTIAAIATAPGRGAVALLRVSGPSAGDMLLLICPDLNGGMPPPRLQRLVVVQHPDTGETIDRALVAWFPAPGSFTGEDTVEISTHGGRVAPQRVLDALFAAGARPALPGEFTHRALGNGKLDLLEAEALLDIIDGRSVAMHQAAVNQMEGGLSRRIGEFRAALIQVDALLAYGIDFPEEDEPPISSSVIQAAASEVLAAIDALIETSRHGELLREGALVVLAGRPNSGKSSLFNALLATQRAIVTDVPGTTRDALEADLSIDGYPFRLVDTAGIRRSEDTVERLGIEVARRYLGAAQIVLFCTEGDGPLDSEESEFLDSISTERIAIIRTKSDAATSPPPDHPGAATIAASARTGDGVPAIRQYLLQSAFGDLPDPAQSPVLTRARHLRALRSARAEIAAFMTAGQQDVPAEFAATHLAAAARHLEDLVGAITPDDVLGRIFSEFCVGK
jgi:tRNA modification GTPase